MKPVNTTQDAIQREIDAKASAGGGTVTIPPGVINLSNALHLRSNVRVVGSEGTILRRISSVSSRLVDRVGYGHYEFTVEEPDLFPMGCGVYIHDDLSWGYYTTVATVIGRRGDLVFIDRPFSHDYGPGANGVVERLFSMIEGSHVSDVAIANLTLDGNLDETRPMDGCRGAGVALHRVDRALIQNIEVTNYRGDALSIGQSTDVIVRNNRIHHNAGIGVHPGGGTVRYVIADNHIHDNGSHGIFYCLRSSHSDCGGNRIERNGDCGISIGERDTHHLIHNNTIIENSGPGIEFRKFVRRGGDHIRIERNVIGANCVQKGDHEMLIAGGHRDLCIAANRLAPAAGKKAICVEAGCEEIHLVDNTILGGLLSPDKIDAADDSIRSTPKANPTPVGPAALDRDGARHLHVHALPSWPSIVTTALLFLMMTMNPTHAAQRTLASNLKLEDVARLQAEVADVMALSDEQTLLAVPAQSGICFTDCPNCDMSSADQGHFAWKPSDPGRIVCKDCHAEYPGNEKYPDDQVLEVRSIQGMHQYPYYTRSDGFRIYFRAHADFLARAQMSKACANLAELYWLTKDERYARRAALILVRFAEVYPGYALHYDYPFHQKKIVPFDHESLTPEEPPRTAKWSQWAYMDISQDLARAYDILRDWPPLREMVGGKANELIERDLIGGMLTYTMRLPETYSNMSPMKWRDAIDAARVIEQPAVVHEVVRRMQVFLDRQFLYDGALSETSPSYVRQVGGWLQLVSASLSGYDDPKGYADPVSGERLDAERVKEVQAIADRVIAILMDARFPDGRQLPVNDTWSDDVLTPRDSMKPALLPGFGVAIMGGGSGDKQFHAWLNFTSGTIHKQLDALSIGLWANGKELLSDIGYTHTKYRYWASSTPSHSTVVVDGRDQEKDVIHSMNRLRSWSSDGMGFSAAEAESAGVYPQTSRYRRCLIAVGHDASDVYLVDVFQVHGGNQHDYILAGSADEASHAAVEGASLAPFNGTLLNKGFQFEFPSGEGDTNDPQSGLGYIRNLQRADADQITVNYRLSASPQLGSRTRLWAGEGSTTYLGEAPSIRQSQGNDSMLDRFMMPMTVARRQGKDLQSTFIAVHEPVNGSPRIADVKVKQDGNIVQLEVSHGDVVDYIFVSLDGPAKAQANALAGAIQFEGTQGFVRTRDGQAVEMHLVNGIHLSLGDVKLEGIPALSGEIVESHREESPESRGWFVVNEQLDITADDRLLLARYPDGTTQGYHIIQVEPESGGTRIHVREKPAFQYTKAGIELSTFPQRTIEGRRVNYEILQSKHLRHE
jgi:hypothetical protein